MNNETDADLICICGDLTDGSTDTQFATYKSLVATYSPNVPVYAISGNHDGMITGIENRIETYTGHSLYYSVTHGDDVFIMVGTIGGEQYSNGVVFAEGELQWLYEKLEANRNKRCFVFQHIFAGVAYEASPGVYVTDPTCGDAGGIYTNWCWHDTNECIVFENLMKHYKNVTWFHGHSHIRFSLQKYGQLYANYSESEGYRSVHIPSLAVLREDTNTDGKAETNSVGSEGYVVDVYENGIHLRGRDFVKGEFLPIASYWLDTTLQTIEAGTFTDPTGTIIP
jgi:predicted phosphodiesterase